MWWRIVPWLIGALGLTVYLEDEDVKIPFGQKVADKIYVMDPIDVTGDNPWWNVRPKDYDTAIIGLLAVGLLVWGTKN